jgi:hypothetical protein
MPGCAAAPSAGLPDGSGTGTAVAEGPAGISYRQAPYLHVLGRRLAKGPSAASHMSSEWRLSAPQLHRFRLSAVEDRLDDVQCANSVSLSSLLKKPRPTPSLRPASPRAQSDNAGVLVFDHAVLAWVKVLTFSKCAFAALRVGERGRSIAARSPSWGQRCAIRRTGRRRLPSCGA